jgi:hypothetical protein
VKNQQQASPTQQASALGRGRTWDIFLPPLLRVLLLPVFEHPVLAFLRDCWLSFSLSSCSLKRWWGSSGGLRYKRGGRERNARLCCRGWAKQWCKRWWWRTRTRALVRARRFALLDRVPPPLPPARPIGQHHPLLLAPFLLWSPFLLRPCLCKERNGFSLSLHFRKLVFLFVCLLFLRGPHTKRDDEQQHVVVLVACN